MKPPIISVNVYDPLRRADFRFYQRVLPDDYSHSISAFGGYDTARIGLNVGRTEAEDWLENGLARHVSTKASALDQIWEGFVNQIDIKVGPLSVTYGPLIDMANRVAVIYTPVEYDLMGAGLIVGQQTWTADEDDQDSQDRFGVFYKMVTAANVPHANARVIRSTYLEENRWPKLTQSWSSQGDAVSVTLNCLGYWHMLKFPVDFPASGTVDASVKVTDTLGRNPNNAWLPFGTDNVETNTLNLPEDESNHRLASQIIAEAVAHGDASYNRWLFYVLDDREAYYHQAPTTVEYQAYVEQNSTVIRSTSQALVAPWRMRPGHWMAFYDFLAGRNIVEVNRDPRMMFIEKVTYRAPFGLQLQGGKSDTISQMLAQYGMGGMA